MKIERRFLLKNKNKLNFLKFPIVISSKYMYNGTVN